MKRIILLIIPLLLLTGCQKESSSNVVNVLNWSSYIPDTVLRDFEKEYNIKVNYTTYSSNEELLAKITSARQGTYDVIFPSDYMVELLIQKKLIQKLDKTKLSNSQNINNTFLNQTYDMSNDYSLPFLTTIVVIAVNKDHVQDNIKIYKDLLNKKYKNNIVIIDDQRIVIGMALLAEGYDMSEVDDGALENAKNWLLKLKPNIKAYDSDSPKQFFISEEADIGVMWHAEAEIAQSENPNIEIIYPSEGHAISTDNYCITTGSKNTENAYLFINYLMRDDVVQKIIEEYPYVSPVNVKQKSNVDTFNIFTGGHYVKNIGGDIKKYDKLWAEIK